MMLTAIADFAWVACWVVLYMSLLASLLAFLLLGVYALFCWIKKEIDNGK
jgi:nicotinamide riboside transporter PnuC